jgi:hypothetical protein
MKLTVKSVIPLARRTAKLVIVSLVGGVSTIAEAQMREATEPELAMIRGALMLDEIPEWRHYRVLEVQGAYTDASGDRSARLDGWVYFEPYEVPFDLCMMEARFISGIGADNGFDWSLERFAYWNWISSSVASCEIADRSQVPTSAVQSSEPIPSATMSYILANSDELLALAYGYLESTMDGTEPANDRILRYRENSSYRLERIAIVQQSSPDFGFAYRATYRASGAVEGPSVTFSVTQLGFEIHVVGLWIA